MIKLPIVLILSEGKETPENIIDNIRKIPISEDKDALITTPPCNLTGYKFHLVTKYYSTDIYLVPFKDDIKLLPSEILEATEAVLIYFDPGKRSFSGKIPTYAEFLKENDIELGILLCDKLYDDSNEGITYKEAKQASKFLDVIELERTRDEDEEDDPHDPLGYDELLQALRSFLWSNAQVESGNAAAGQVCHDESKPNDNASESQETQIEAELAAFEKLLTEVVMFKNSTSTWSRNERLAFAQQFADNFEDLIGEGGASSSDEG